MTYDVIKKNFDRKLWSILQVRLAVEKGVISKEQYKEITKKEYN